MKIDNVAVFCGSNYGNDPDLRKSIVDLGQALEKRGWGLVYGGGRRGLMGDISAYMTEHGCRTIGVSPRRFYKQGDEKLSKEFHLVDTMHQRKALMYEKADAFIVFPGGIGTLDEGAEISSWYQIGFSGKPVAFYDYKGFFSGLQMQLDRMLQDGFIKQEFRDFLLFSNDVEKIFGYFDSFEFVKGKWEK